MEAAQLRVGEPRGGEHLVGRVGGVALAPVRLPEAAAVDQLEEAQLQLVRVQLEGAVEALAEGGKVLHGESGDQVDVQVDVAGGDDAREPVDQQAHVGVAIAGGQGGRVEGLKPCLHLEQARRRGGQQVKGLVVEKVGSDLKVVAHIADLTPLLRANQPGQKEFRACPVAVEGTVDELDCFGAALSQTDQQPEGLLLGHELHSVAVLAAAETEGAAERAAPRGFHIGHAALEGKLPVPIVEVGAGRRGGRGGGQVQAVRRAGAQAGHVRRSIACQQAAQERREAFLACAAQEVVRGHVRQRFLHGEGGLRAAHDDGHFRPERLQPPDERGGAGAVPDVQAHAHHVRLRGHQPGEELLLRVVDVQVADGGLHLGQAFVHRLFQAEGGQRHVDVLACKGGQGQAHGVSSVFFS